MRRASGRGTIESSPIEVRPVATAPKVESRVSPEPEPEPARRGRERHLTLAPHVPVPAADDARRAREARWVAALLAVATAALFGLWTAAMLGAADAAWWPAAWGAVLVAVVALGVVTVRKSG
jgi:hypothetical protein